MSQFGNHQQVKCKCLKCGVHFVVCTWHAEKHATESLHCPECGQHEGLFCLWREDVPAPICTVVPGAAMLSQWAMGFNFRDADAPA